MYLPLLLHYIRKFCKRVRTLGTSIAGTYMGRNYKELQMLFSNTLMRLLNQWQKCCVNPTMSRISKHWIKFGKNVLAPITNIVVLLVEARFKSYVLVLFYLLLILWCRPMWWKHVGIHYYTRPFCRCTQCELVHICEIRSTQYSWRFKKIFDWWRW